MKRQILVIEDETAIADNIQYALRSDGFESHHCELAQQGLDILKVQLIDLIILDVGLPDINGFELCKKIRQYSEVPIIFLTARSEEIDRVVGLEIGGDDYIAKPFSPRELVARVKATLKRMPAATSAPLATITKNNNTSSVEGDIESAITLFKLDNQKMKISYCQVFLELTPYEFGILKLLMSQPDRVFSRELLLQRVWQDPESCLDRVVDTHIKSLRSKLRIINHQREPLKTHRGLGYSLNEKV